MLATRLSRRGVSLSAGSLAVLLAQESASAGMPTRLIAPTAQAASLFAAGGTATAGAVPAKVVALTGEVMKMMLLSKIRSIAAMVLVASGLVVGGTGLSYQASGGEPASPQEPASAKNPGLLPDLPTIGDVQKGPVEKPAEPPAQLNATAGPEPVPAVPAPILPPPAPTAVTDPDAGDPLSALIVNGDHTPQQLQRAKELIEEMITLEKEASGKSSDQIETMVQQRAGALEAARWQVRVLDAQIRRLKVIKQTRHVSERTTEATKK
jgi:hypothetical protein